MKQFVDTKSSSLVQRLQGKEVAEAHIDATGDILVEGEFAGHITGLTFQRDPRMASTPARAVRVAIDKVAGAHLQQAAALLAKAEDTAFSLSDKGDILWQQDIGNDGAKACVGHLQQTENQLAPTPKLQADESLNGATRQLAETRIKNWLHQHIAATLAPLVNLQGAENLSGLARGLAFQLVEQGGYLPRHKVSDELSALDQPARATLRKYGVRFGAYNVFLPALLKPAPARLMGLLWSLKNNRDPQKDLENAPAAGLTSYNRDQQVPTAFYLALGFRPCGGRVVRFDMLERLSDIIRPILQKAGIKTGFAMNADMMSVMGCSEAELAEILTDLGYVSHQVPAHTENEKEKEKEKEKLETAAPETEPITEPETNQSDDDSAPKEAESAAKETEEKATLTLLTLWRPKPHDKNRSQHKNQNTDKKRAPKGRPASSAKSANGQNQRTPSKGKTNQNTQADPNSPFAVLEALKITPEKATPKTDKNE